MVLALQMQRNRPKSGMATYESGFEGYMAAIILLATIWRAPGWPTDAILEPKKAPAGQRILRVTSVFLGKSEVSCALATDWGTEVA